MTIRADLHIHSCLSPCGSLEMSPARIIDRAVREGLDLIALTDHNTALNCPAFEEIANRRGDIRCLYGLELASREEVHALAIFSTSAEAVSFSNEIFEFLPDIRFDPELFGDQVYVDAEENIIGSIDRYLVSGLTLSLEELEARVHHRRGLFVPSHVDRALFSITSQLGFIPDGRNYDAIEFSRHFLKRGQNPLTINRNDRYAVITGSDSHYLDGIGAAFTEIECETISLDDVSSALRARRVRTVVR
ncbi:MAG TPA: PHP domain-containing protein [Spirochaetota bacterium]